MYGLSAHPNVDIDLDERPSPEVARAIVEELADAGVVADHADLTGLQSFPFSTDGLVLIVPSGHAVAGRERIAFAEALGFDFVGLLGDSALHQHLARHAARAGGHMRLRARVGGLDAVCRMVALGAGAAVIPREAAGPCCQPELHRPGHGRLRRCAAL
jgi:DNA-binding transcriptional LysR family regulator